MTSFKLTVLMYHALMENGHDCVHADAHYAVPKAVFKRHIRLASEAGLRISSVADILSSGDGRKKIAMTFDDGHESNLVAAQEILAVSGSADLFVNPSTVGLRGHLDWQALSDLAAAGFSIQSHGYTHRYFDQLSDSEIERELYVSKLAIENRVGRPVVLFAPPGGRLAPQVRIIAQRLGYHGICSSRVGTWRGTSAWRIPRFAVLASTTDDQLRRWIMQDPFELAVQQVRYQVLARAKRLLGNQVYDHLRGLVLHAQRGPERP